MSTLGRAAFLDRDGVINRDSGYVGRPEDFELLPGVVEALRLLADEDHALVVVTNQSGIGRGYYTEADYDRVTSHMRQVLLTAGISLDAVVHCPHLPDTGCTCRKPEPGMILTGLAIVDADPGASVMFGDKPSDIAAGRAAALGQCWLISPDAATKDRDATGIGSSLLDCVRRYRRSRPGTIAR